MSVSSVSVPEEKNIFLGKECTILEAAMITKTEKYFKLKFKDGSAMDYQPGQIVEAGIPGFGEIPLGISSSPTRNNGSFDLVVRTVGRVSGKLVSLQQGDSMWVRGPLGHGVPVDEFKNNPVLIIAGGIGLCPTRSMIQYILDKYTEFKDFKLFFGCRSPEERLFTDDCENWQKSDRVEFHETVDNADASWKGNVGVITTLFEKTSIDKNSRVLICGPPIMYTFVIKELDTLGISRENVYVDLERRMKCGVGKCGHCQMNDKYVCMDGPVFRYTDIQDLPEAFK